MPLHWIPLAWWHIEGLSGRCGSRDRFSYGAFSALTAEGVANSLILSQCLIWTVFFCCPLFRDVELATGNQIKKQSKPHPK